MYLYEGTGIRIKNGYWKGLFDFIFDLKLEVTDGIFVFDMHLLNVISKYEKQIQASCNFNMVKIMAMAWYLAKKRGGTRTCVFGNCTWTWQTVASDRSAHTSVHHHLVGAYCTTTV